MIGTNEILYVPCLRWKMGEYLAIRRLNPRTHNYLLPIIEIPEIGYDFENQSNSKSIDDHLSKFAKRVKQNWGKANCLIDCHLIEDQTCMSNGQHPSHFIFNGLRNEGVSAIPVITLSSSSEYLAAIRDITTINKKGICFRVEIEDVINARFNQTIQDLLNYFDIIIEQVDLIIDLKAPNFDPLEGFSVLLSDLISRIQNLQKWRTFGIIGTSFPSSLSGIEKGISKLPRNEWLLYKLLISNLRKRGLRIPLFGDYAINHPDLLQLDMRIVKPNASIRYTIKNNWLFVKGKNVRDYKFPQYRGLCESLVKSQFFMGPEFSRGDDYIYKCANNTVSTGNLTTWRFVGTNHHIEKVTLDVANFLFSLDNS